MYNENVMNCFYNPKHMGVVKDYSARGFTGSIECGDAMELTMMIENEVIVEAKFRTYGCTAAIASAETLVELILGKTIDDAALIQNSDIVDYLEGLPDLKLHCSVMGKEVLDCALVNYRGGAIEDTNQDLVCKCKQIHLNDIEDMIIHRSCFYYSELQEISQIGTVCGKCEDRVYGILARAVACEVNMLKDDGK